MPNQTKITELKAKLTNAQATLVETQEQIKHLTKEINDLSFEQSIVDKENDWIERQKITHKWVIDNPEEAAENIKWAKKKANEGLINLSGQLGWDLNDDKTAPLPPWKIFKVADFAEVNNPLLAHVMAKVGIFKSVGAAKKNGWNKPLEVGEWIVTKKKIRIKIIP